MAHPLTPAQVAALARSFAPTPYLAVSRAGVPEETVPLVDGTVELDGASQDRITLTAQVPLDYAPTSWSSLLIPADARVRVLYDMGVGDPVQVASLWLDDVRIRRPEGEVTLYAVPTSARVSQAGFPSGDRRYTGSTVAVVQRIVEDALGRAVTVRVEGGLVGPTITATEAFTGDPWQAVEDLMDAAAGEAFFDATDTLVMRPVPQAVGTPAWTFTTGDTGTLLTYEVSLTRAPNRERMTFRNPDTDSDVVGVATATGNAVWDGPFGRFLDEQDRDGVVSQAQADAAAQEYLNRAGGLLRGLELEAVPHPGVEVGDVIACTFLNGVTELHRVTRVSLPLGMGSPMTMSTRSLPW